MTFAMNIYALQKTNPNVYGDPLTFPLEAPSGQSLLGRTAAKSTENIYALQTMMNKAGLLLGL